jgi:acetylornithine deacetylase/succinyl-diaminopimelate desuccinylase-like protein
MRLVEECRMQKLKIAFLFVALSSVSPLFSQTLRPDSEKQLARDIYKQFVEIQSGFTTGSTTPVAEAAAARLKAAGFSDRDIFVGGASPKKYNIVVRYRGSGKLKPLLLLAHIDVVEAKREDWSMDPEGGGPFNGVDWLLKNHRELIDAEFALNEGGWGEIVDGKYLANYLQVSEKYVMNFRFEVRNKGGHSSLPVKDNAIYHLAGALARLSEFGFPLKTNEVTAAYFRRLGELSAGPEKQDLLKVADGSQDAMQRVAALAPAYNSVLRTTCVATMLEGGHAMNALPQLAAALVNCRVMPEDSPQYVEETLKKVVADEQVSVKSLGEFERGPSSPMRPDVLDAATRITSKMWPGVPVVPNMVMGATDGRMLRAAGIPCYGVQGIFIDRNDIRFHGRDERIPVRSFYEGQAFLYDLVKALSSK